MAEFNLGPLHLLDTFVKEILASNHSQAHLRKEQAKTRRLVTNDLNKSAAMETSEKKRIEEILNFYLPKYIEFFTVFTISEIF